MYDVGNNVKPSVNCLKGLDGNKVVPFVTNIIHLKGHIIMLKIDTTTNKTYEVKQVAKFLLPYIFIVILTSSFVGLVTGWTLRSDFDTLVKTNVTAQVHELMKGRK